MKTINNLNLVRKIAWSFHNTTNIDYNELFSEACLGYCEAIRSFNPARGKLSVWIWIVMTNQLKTYISKEKRNQSTTLSETHIELTTSQPKTFEMFLSELPPNSQQLVNIVLKNLNEIPDELPPKLARGRIIQILRQKHWSWPKIWKTVKELKLALR